MSRRVRLTHANYGFPGFRRRRINPDIRLCRPRAASLIQERLRRADSHQGLGIPTVEKGEDQQTISEHHRVKTPEMPYGICCSGDRSRTSSCRMPSSSAPISCTEWHQRLNNERLGERHLTQAPRPLQQKHRRRRRGTPEGQARSGGGCRL